MNDAKQESKMPQWTDKGLVSLMELGEGVTLELYWLAIGSWVCNLRVADHLLMKGRELIGLDSDQRDSAKRLALMFAANHLSVYGMQLVKASTVASAVLEQAVRDGLEQLREQREASEDQP